MSKPASHNPDIPAESQVVEEVRRIRARLWKSAGGSAKAYVNMIQRLASKRKAVRSTPGRGRKSAS